MSMNENGLEAAREDISIIINEKFEEIFESLGIKDKSDLNNISYFLKMRDIFNDILQENVTKGMTSNHIKIMKELQVLINTQLKTINIFETAQFIFTCFEEYIDDILNSDDPDEFDITAEDLKKFFSILEVLIPSLQIKMTGNF